MNKEITAEDIIKAIDEMFDEGKVQENETFWRGFRYGIMQTQQYIDKLNQELQRKDNIIKQTIETIKELIDDSEDTTCYEITNTVKKLLLEELENGNK